MITDETKISKFLSLILRHKPETIGLVLDDNGWAETAVLLEGMQKAGYAIDLDILKGVVRSSDKNRFGFNDDLTRIRANQGHSVQVDLNLSPQLPPDVLYHGTATRNLDSIKERGLLKQSRHHVHLSEQFETAKSVGMRYGKPVVLTILAKEMHESGIHFFRSENGVWLTDYVDSKYLEFEGWISKTDSRQQGNYSHLRILAETDKYLIGHSYENAYLVDKETGSQVVHDDFYGDPHSALISKNNDWAIIAGEHITIWSNGKMARIDRVELHWVHAIRTKDDTTVEILIDPWSEMSAIWILDTSTLEFKKVRDFDDYKEVDYNGEAVIW